MNAPLIAAALLFPRQWRNWVFVGLGYATLFVISLDRVESLNGTSTPFATYDGSVVFFGERITLWSWVILAFFGWHCTVGTWRARLTTARQRRQGYARGEAPLAVQAVQAATAIVRPQSAPEPIAQRTTAPAPVSAPPAPTVPQLVIPTVLGSGRKVQWAEDHGTFTVTDRRRFVIDEL